MALLPKDTEASHKPFLEEYRAELHPLTQQLLLVITTKVGVCALELVTSSAIFLGLYMNSRDWTKIKSRQEYLPVVAGIQART